MANKEITLTFDMATREVKGEAIGYAAKACEVDVGAILDSLGCGVKRKPKQALQLRNTREKATR